MKISELKKFIYYLIMILINKSYTLSFINMLGAIANEPSVEIYVCIT